MNKKIKMGTSFKTAMEEAAMLDATIEEDEAFQAIEKRMDSIGQNGNDGLVYEKSAIVPEKPLTKYQRVIGSEIIDVYDILVAFDVRCPARQHAIKKLLMPGIRHSKTKVQDISEAKDSIDRALKLENEK